MNEDLLTLECHGLRSMEALGFPLVSAESDAALRWLENHLSCQTGPSLLLFHANCHTLYSLNREGDVLSAARSTATLLLEGIALVTALRLLGLGRVADLNGTDLVPKVIASTGMPLRLALLGGEPGVAERAARRLKNLRDRLEIVAVLPGRIDDTNLPKITSVLVDAKPDILLLGLGSPLQERMALHFAPLLETRIIWTVGGLFDFLAGDKPRAPVAIRRLRLEWAFRLSLEPSRLWRRTLIEFPWLIGRVLIARIRGA